MENNPEDQKYSSNLGGPQTLFSVSGRNQLQLISIADNKANMITAICTALIFLIIGLLSSGFTHNGILIVDKLEYALPLGILLTFCSISTICAILALKPKIVRPEKEGRSLLFFHNYYRMSLAEYKAKMHEMMKSPEEVYDHLLTDMYHNGLVLERKYALLGFSYTLFLMAIICSFIAYVIIAVF